MNMFEQTAPAAPTTLHVRTVPGLPVSVRIVTTPTSTLAIGATPWRHTRRLAALPLFSGACLYVLTGTEARIGKTTGLDSRLRDHRRAMPMTRIDQVFAIASPGFGSDAITVLEAILTQAARKAGVMPMVGAPLRMPPLAAQDALQPLCPLGRQGCVDRPLSCPGQRRRPSGAGADR